ncbi:hypothetical protein MPSEU_000480100 [Mayamaea pseudoterrestris]|nr:hypothetical protein MPSEU_000480100 [Mayamaea pseudoterrestris]
MKEELYKKLNSFLSIDDQRLIVDEILTRHRQCCSSDKANGLDINLDGTNSFRLELGIGCGENLCQILAVSTDRCRQAFKQGATRLKNPSPSLISLHKPDTPLTGLSLLYGPNSFMSPHYDSPTQPGQKEEWLCMFTFGLPCLFRLDDLCVEMRSGDALIMDSMSVLHGVEKILVDSGADGLHSCSRIGLPIASRLGLLFWQGRLVAIDALSPDDIGMFDGLSTLYGNVENESD